MESDRFTIEVLTDKHWQIEDTLTGEFANPVDGITNVLKGLVKSMNKFYNESEELKQNIKELQNDKLLTELQMKYDKKQEHIVVLENKIRRMREAIHKLEWLATHRNGELIRENEQLKAQLEQDDLKNIKKANIKLFNENFELQKENEQLKQTMKKVAELLSDEVDLFSNKAIEHDINAYMELKELDNKDAYCMAKATKTAIKMLKSDVK